MFGIKRKLFTMKFYCVKISSYKIRHKDISQYRMYSKYKVMGLGSSQNISISNQSL
jgi:hypothetical protein